MSVNENWCVDDYRDPTVPHHQWLLQKAFIDHYKSVYPEERLVCLSQCCLNIMFLGSRYSDAIMNLLNSLSNDVLILKQFTNDENFRINFIKNCYNKDYKVTHMPSFNCISTEGMEKKSTTLQQFHCKTILPQTFVKSNSAKVFAQADSTAHLRNTRNYELIIDEIRSQQGITGKLVLSLKEDYTKSPYTSLQSSTQPVAAVLKISETDTPEKYRKKNKVQYQLSIDNEIICSELITAGNVEEKKKVKDVLSLKAINILQDYCFTLLKLDHTAGPVVTKNGVFDSETNVTTNDEPERLSHLNCEIGYKLMKKMGWTGGGLGRQTQGRKDIIEANVKINRAGLGTANVPNALRDLLHKYSKENDFKNLVFSTDFTKQERAQIHALALKLKLKSASRGSGDNRQLTVSRTRDKWTLIKILMQNNDRNEDYQLIYPKKFNLDTLEFD